MGGSSALRGLKASLGLYVCVYYLFLTIHYIVIIVIIININIGNIIIIIIVDIFYFCYCLFSFYYYYYYCLYILKGIVPLKGYNVFIIYIITHGNTLAFGQSISQGF